MLGSILKQITHFAFLKRLSQLSNDKIRVLRNKQSLKSQRFRHHSAMTGNNNKRLKMYSAPRKNSFSIIAENLIVPYLILFLENS